MGLEVIDYGRQLINKTGRDGLDVGGLRSLLREPTRASL